MVLTSLQTVWSKLTATAAGRPSNISKHTAALFYWCLRPDVTPDNDTTCVHCRRLLLSKHTHLLSLSLSHTHTLSFSSPLSLSHTLYTHTQAVQNTRLTNKTRVFEVTIQTKHREQGQVWNKTDGQFSRSCRTNGCSFELFDSLWINFWCALKENNSSTFVVKTHCEYDRLPPNLFQLTHPHCASVILTHISSSIPLQHLMCTGLPCGKNLTQRG